MRSLVALLAAILAAGIAGCGGGAEPGASREATLVLDFQPNAVHAGIYSALAHDDYEAAGVELEIREPTESTDAPRLLEAGRVELAILTAGDLGIALERGLGVRPVAEIVQLPLGAVIAADRREVGEPRDLEGATVGVTGLPSDDAVLDAVIESDDADPDAVERVQIGFESVAALAAGRLDAATAFWSAEGVALRRLGIPTREFRVSDHGASYPELLLVAAGTIAAAEPELIEAIVEATERGYRRVRDDPEQALADLIEAVPGLDRDEQGAQLEALLAADAFGERITPPDLEGWLEFADRHGIADVDSIRERLAEPGAGAP